MIAYREGFRARARGESYTANPYQQGSDDSGRWIAGWQDQDMHLRDLDEVLSELLGEAT